MSHAVALTADTGTHELWSDSHGLARRLEGRTEYKRLTDRVDTTLQWDLDGRRNLSQQALTEFIQCLQGVSGSGDLMSNLFELGNLTRRLRTFAERTNRLKSEASNLLEEALTASNMTGSERPPHVLRKFGPYLQNEPAVSRARGDWPD